jgi:hypothetical protein
MKAIGNTITRRETPAQSPRLTRPSSSLAVVKRLEQQPCRASIGCGRGGTPLASLTGVLFLHRTFIRLALISLLLGVGTGALVQVRRALELAPWPYAIVSIHVHLLTVGFLLNMVMGVAHWMFPRLPGATAVGAARDPLAWANLVSLNLGLLLRVVSEPWIGAGWAHASQLASAALQVVGVLFFLLAIWRRVRFPKVRPPGLDRP